MDTEERDEVTQDQIIITASMSILEEHMEAFRELAT